MVAFDQWYNLEHRHAGVGLHTSADILYGLATAKAVERRAVLADARARHPHRFSTTTISPKILNVPGIVWINPPAHRAGQEADTTSA